jgi:hypothetical protein
LEAVGAGFLALPGHLAAGVHVAGNRLRPPCQGRQQYRALLRLPENCLGLALARDGVAHGVSMVIEAGRQPGCGGRGDREQLRLGFALRVEERRVSVSQRGGSAQVAALIQGVHGVSSATRGRVQHHRLGRAGSGLRGAGNGQGRQGEETQPCTGEGTGCNPHR